MFGSVPDFHSLSASASGWRRVISAYALFTRELYLKSKTANLNCTQDAWQGKSKLLFQKGKNQGKERFDTIQNHLNQHIKLRSLGTLLFL